MPRDPRTPTADDGAAVQLVIFDCDGVLVDSEPIAARVSSRALTDLGWPVTPEEVHRRFVGCTGEFFRREVERELGRPLPAWWGSETERLLDAAFDTELEPVPGVIEALDSVAALGLPFCVASNSGHRRVRRALRRTGLLDRFDGRIFSASDVPRGKPAPDVYLHAAAVLGVSPERCVVVEDSATGVTAGIAAGMRVLQYVPAAHPAAGTAVRPTARFPEMTQLPALLRGLDEIPSVSELEQA